MLSKKSFSPQLREKKRKKKKKKERVNKDPRLASGRNANSATSLSKKKGKRTFLSDGYRGREKRRLGLGKREMYVTGGEQKTTSSEGRSSS